MSDVFYFIIILIASPTDVDVIYNKVSVAEYKKFEAGMVDKKSYPNSPEGLRQILKDGDTFKEDNACQEMVINLAGDNPGFLGAIGDKVTSDNVEAYAKTRNLGIITDKVFVAFVHEKLVKNIAR